MTLPAVARGVKRERGSELDLRAHLHDAIGRSTPRPRASLYGPPALLQFPEVQDRLRQARGEALAAAARTAAGLATEAVGMLAELMRNAASEGVGGSRPSASRGPYRENASR